MSGRDFIVVRHAWHARRPRRAFSLIELVMVIGVVMVLVGLLVPAAQRSVHETREARALAVMRDNAVAVTAYECDFRSYPNVMEQAWGSAHRWAHGLALGGYVAGEHLVEPYGAPSSGVTTVFMGLAFVAEPRMQMFGWTVADPRSSRVGSEMVTYTSQKGLLVRAWEDPTVVNPRGFCCGARAVVSPVAFVDGSASRWRAEDMVGGRPLVVRDEVGVPALSTWDGCRGRDR